MPRQHKLFLVAALSALLGSSAGADTLTEARYTTPVERYGHFALGRSHEYARLSATTRSGRQLTLTLPDDEVFEDLAPRLVRLAADEAPVLLAIVSRHGVGARLVLVGLSGDTLAISAQSAAIGIPNRWLNPVAVVDLDGDGRAEIAAVIMPHLGGPLKVYRRVGLALVEVAALVGFSNHVFGATELALSAAMSIAGQTRLLVPDTTRRGLRIVALQGDRLIETGRCAFASPIVGPVTVISAREVSLGTGSGTAVIAPGDCPKP